MKNIDESRAVARRIRAEPKHCYLNARKAVLRLDDYAGATYVEGFAITYVGMAIEHAWISRDGDIIDPTLPEGVRTYFPGLEFVGREGIERFLASPEGRRCRRSPFFYAYGWGGHESPSFRRARQDAERHMLSLAGE